LSGEVNTVRELVKFIPLDAGDSMGITPLHIAKRLGYESVAHQLEEAGANADLQDEFGKTPRNIQLF